MASHIMLRGRHPYEFVAKLDEKTSKICRHYDKKVFKVKDMVPGVNARQCILIVEARRYLM
ncbi:hypothetical protein [Staphylococcus delphini]|uniref:hypothetical protein n=1 Tax=Staphylococcus delphini TaxID=53344 RepID=UPI001F4E39FD|nr:hypothetical protein [Staphylococcus delphini]